MRIKNKQKNAVSSIEEVRALEKEFNDSTQPNSDDRGLYTTKKSKKAKEKIIKGYKSYNC